MRFISFCLIVLFASFCLGCAMGWEFGKNILGVSTKALEEDRDHGASKIYNKGFDICYDAVRDALTELGASVFVQKYHKHLIVAVGFEGAVDTTEVGIFFDEISSDKTKIDIVSLNKSLQIEASDEIFTFLDKRFGMELVPLVSPAPEVSDAPVSSEAPAPSE